MDMLQGIQDRGGEGEERPKHRDERHDYALSIPKPVIAAINGACAGLGFVHAMMCDIRFAAEGAKFTSAFARRGLIAEHGVSYMLPRVVGPSNALDILMSGRVFLADEAKEMGVVSRVLAPEDLLSTSVEYARDLGKYSAPWSMAQMKKQVWNQLDLARTEALAESNSLMVDSLKRNDFKEGVASFVQKRDPAFEPVTKV
jgi:enoyl-CoA hydratase/carnithine racemase